MTLFDLSHTVHHDPLGIISSIGDPYSCIAPYCSHTIDVRERLPLRTVTMVPSVIWSGDSQEGLSLYFQALGRHLNWCLCTLWRYKGPATWDRGCPGPQMTCVIVGAHAKTLLDSEWDTSIKTLCLNRCYVKDSMTLKEKNKIIEGLKKNRLNTRF